MTTPDAAPNGEGQRGERQRQQLAAWLAAYKLDRALRAGTTSPPAAAATWRQPGAEPVTPGQIRLLPPAAVSLSELERPVYVLVVPGTTDTHVMIIPFSRFDVAATPDEWVTGLGPAALQVLCLWNARAIATKALSRSWLAGCLSEPEFAAVRAALPQSAPTQGSSHRGPPLHHPLDPRHVYLQEETILLDELIIALDQAVSPRTTIPYEIPETRIAFLRAAEPPPGTGGNQQE